MPNQLPVEFYALHSSEVRQARIIKIRLVNRLLAFFFHVVCAEHRAVVLNYARRLEVLPIGKICLDKRTRTSCLDIDQVK